MKIEHAAIEQALEIMDWFSDKRSVLQWGSPFMKYPLEREAFLQDIHWGEMPTRVAFNENGKLLAFGQYYLKLGRCHLARLVINPEFRGQGLGEAFVAALMDHAGADLDTNKFSLFVLTANRPAYNCYRRLGFELAAYPEGDPVIEDCIFMVARRDDTPYS
jgi:RimJ/RimL family protein N-acetyltransferase